jgi:hypothetical protein
MPLREASLRNFEKARANWRQPRPWRSYAGRVEGNLPEKFVFVSRERPR